MNGTTSPLLYSTLAAAAFVPSHLPAGENGRWSELPEGRFWRRSESGDVEYRFRILLSNALNRQVDVQLDVAGCAPDSAALPHRLVIEPQQATTFPVVISIPAEENQRLPPFSSLTATLNVWEADADEYRPFAPPLDLNLATAGPLLGLDSEWVAKIRQRAESTPPHQRLRRAAIKNAETALEKLDYPIAAPLETGWLEGPPDRPWHARHWPRYEPVEILPDGKFRCPICDTIWTPTDVQKGRDRFRNQRAALQPLGLAALLTGEERFAQPARQILLAIAAAYCHYPPSPTGTRFGLNYMHECQFLSPALVCLWYLKAAGLISPEELKTIEEGLINPAVETLQASQAGTPNQQIFRAATIGLAGLVLDWPPYLAWALRHPQKGWLPLALRYIGADGGWKEGSPSYHMTAAQWLIPFPATLSFQGFNLFEQDAELRTRMTAFFTFPLRIMRPDFRLPNLNDGGLSGSGAAWYAAAWSLTGEESLLPWVSPDLFVDTPANLPPRNPPRRSVKLPDFGVAILNDDGTDGRENWVLLDYGPHGGGHGHFDKLNVLSFLHGQPIHDDSGSAYASPLHFSWLRNTLSHNTIVVDEKAQQPCQGSLDHWSSLPEQPPMLSASTELAYSGVRLERTIVLAFGVQVLIDTARSDDPHQYDWIFTSYGTVSNASFPVSPRGPLPSQPLPPEVFKRNLWNWTPTAGVGYDVPRNLLEGRAESYWRLDWEGVKAPYLRDRPPIRVRWLGWVSSPVHIVWGDVPGLALAPDAMRWVRVRQEGKEAVWVTVLSPGEDPLDAVEVTPAEEGLGFAIRLLHNDNEIGRIVWNREAGRPLKAGPIRTKDKAIVATAFAPTSEP